MPVVGFAKAFQQTHIAQKARAGLQQPYEAPNPKCDEVLIKHKYALNGMQLALAVYFKLSYLFMHSTLVSGYA